MIKHKFIQIARENKANEVLYNGTKEAFDNLDSLRGLINLMFSD